MEVKRKRRLPTVTVASIRESNPGWYICAREIFGYENVTKNRINALDVIAAEHQDLNDENKLCYLLDWSDGGRHGVTRVQCVKILPRVIWKKHHDRAQKQGCGIWPQHPEVKRVLASIKRDLNRWLKG